MEGALYYSHQVVVPADINTCLSTAGYETALDPFGDGRLFVHFTAVYEGHKFDEYCYWLLDPQPFDEIDPENRQYLIEHGLDPASTFAVGLHPSSIPYLISIFRSVLTCFGGHIKMEHHLYDLGSIDQLHWPEHNDFDEDE